MFVIFSLQLGTPCLTGEVNLTLLALGQSLHHNMFIATKILVSSAGRPKKTDHSKVRKIQYIYIYIYIYIYGYN